jgi:hypothetical protein
VATWRIIDGRPLFSKACILLVVSRVDQFREWFVLHPGIPLPFKVTGETKLVTDSETKVIDALLKRAGNPTARYFVQGNPGFSPGELIVLMTAIRDAAASLINSSVRTPLRLSSERDYYKSSRSPIRLR